MPLGGNDRGAPARALPTALCSPCAPPWWVDRPVGCVGLTAVGLSVLVPFVWSWWFAGLTCRVLGLVCWLPLWHLVVYRYSNVRYRWGWLSVHLVSVGLHRYVPLHYRSVSLRTSSLIWLVTVRAFFGSWGVHSPKRDMLVYDK